jgi:hypothetical protein
MIQRIQTIYLLIATLIIGTLFYVPYAEISNGMGAIYCFDAKGFYPESAPNAGLIMTSMPIVVLCAISVLFILVTIFQFKNLARQATFSRINILILIILLGLISYDVWKCTKLITGSYSMKIALAFPLIAMVLIYMALKAIKKDEQLLKSINRIR